MSNTSLTENTNLTGTSIEILHPVVGHNIRHAVLDFDGTISLIRDGWQNVMVPMMVEVLAETPATENDEQLEEIVVEFVDRLTGKQTIYQMMQLAEEVKKRGGTEADPLDYKDLYNRRLLPDVEQRIAELADGSLEGESLRVPGSLDLLQKLRQRDIHLYLASGTDIEFVRHEAELLGVADYFDGGIFGALREYAKFSKAMVIQKILSDFNLPGNQLLIIGDGYVEIENAKSVSAIAVGVASKENNRYQMNANKRERLIRAGADIIVEDYAEVDVLLNYLFEKQ
ncbi:MAG: HAD family hydrolase [Candidatus Poribacteria bacterium]|nr:HAD family hydrolase [Candidatus Poribacteria bacterium]